MSVSSNRLVQQPAAPETQPIFIPAGGRLADAWKVAVLNSTLTAAQKNVMFALQIFADWSTGGKAHPGLDRLMAVSNLKNGAVNAALAAGVKAGLLVQVRRGGGRSGRASEYQLMIPADAVEESLELIGRRVGEGESGEGMSPQPRSHSEGMSPQPRNNVSTAVETTFHVPPMKEGGLRQVGTSLAGAARELPAPASSIDTTGTDDTDADAPAVLDAPPPDHCDRHPVNLKDIACGACGRAREAREAWEKHSEQRRIATDARRRADEQQAKAEHEQAAIGCPKCNGTGYDDHWRCDHDPNTPKQAEVNGRGRARAWAVVDGLSKSKSSQQ